MQELFINLEYGREAFGADPAGYHVARPPYPDWVYETLVSRGCIIPNTPTFEIGPGTGTATCQLLALGAKPLIAIEPNHRLAAFLRQTFGGDALQVLEEPFEGADLPDAAFNLGLSATAFHWLNEGPALEKAARLLRPGGWWAMVWNVFGDPDREDPFHEATKELLQGPVSPAEPLGKLPFALDVQARMNALEKSSAFDTIEHYVKPWSLHLNADQVVALYSTFSNINIRADRGAVLNELARIASVQFNGHVTRNMVTILYIARRRA